MTAAPRIPAHEIVGPLGARSWLVRRESTGVLSVARTVDDPAAAAARARRLATLAAVRGGETLVADAAGTRFALRLHVTGESLAELLARGAVPEGAAALRIAADVAAGVAALHARGLAHGRLHPGNVIVREDGRASVVDSLPGFRAPPSPDDPGALAAARFAAPEVLRGARPSRASDAFSLALVAHAVLTGTAPLRGDPTAVLAQLLGGHAALLPPTGADAAVDGAISRALAARAWRRPPAAALAASLAALRSGASPRPGAKVLVFRAAAAGSRAAVRSMRATRSVGTTAGQAARAVAAASARAARGVRGGLAMVAAARPSEPIPRSGFVVATAVAILLVVALAVGIGWWRSPGRTARDVQQLLAAGRAAEARKVVEAALRERPREPLLQKLSGDVACARRDVAGCLKAWRGALEANPALGHDATLRRDALALLSRADERRAVTEVVARLDDVEAELVAAARSPRYWLRWNAVRALEARRQDALIPWAEVYALDLLHGASCETRQAAALKLEKLRDPAVLPQLERAEQVARSSLREWFCTGSEVRAALESTRRAAGHRG